MNQFAWAILHHESFEEEIEVDDKRVYRCMQAIDERAQDYAKDLGTRTELGMDVQAGSSNHIWLSFSEFVAWSKDGTTSSFTLDESIQYDFVTKCANLVSESCVPVFVSLCTSSKFFNAEEMNMENSVCNTLAVELAKAGVRVSSNPLFWSECSNFTDGNFKVINPSSVENPIPEGDRWDFNAAFACIDKFLSREKML